MIGRLLASLAALFSLHAQAGPQEGDKAPEFTAQAALAGQVVTYSLAEALANGPVVLYFYPAAFTPGCNVEAHQFAEAVDQYKALGASVIGVSHDDIDTQKRFSVSECQGRFAVAADPERRISKAYGATMALLPRYASRVSFVITPDRKVLYTYRSMSPSQHVANTLAALRKWRAEQR